MDANAVEETLEVPINRKIVVYKYDNFPQKDTSCQWLELVTIGIANSVTHITREFAGIIELYEKVARKIKPYLDNKFGEDMDNYSGGISTQE